MSRNRLCTKSNWYADNKSAPLLVSTTMAAISMALSHSSANEMTRGALDIVTPPSTEF